MIWMQSYLLCNTLKVNLLLSSTKVREYWKPSYMGCWQRPHMSEWMRSKEFSLKLLEFRNGNLFCLARGHIEQLKNLLTKDWF